MTDTVSNPSGVRDLLSQGIFISKDPEDKINMLNTYLPMVVELEQINGQAKADKRPLTEAERKHANML